MLAFALVPTLSRALAHQQGAAWADICTAQGARVLAQASTGDAPAGPATHALEHCALCALAGDGLAPPPALAGFRPASVAQARPAVLADRGTAPVAGWPAAQPRAPPSLG